MTSINLIRRIGVANVVAALVVATAVFLFVWSYSGVTDPQGWRTGALVVFALGLFATHVVAEYLAALIVLFLAVALNIAPTDVVFSGFTLGGLWLLFSGIIIGVAVGESGLGVYIARRFLSRVELDYPRAVILLVIVSASMGLVMPATIPRIIILLPITLGLAQAMGFAEGSRGYTGLAIAVIAGTFFPTFAVMTANLPTVLHVSAIQSIYGTAPPFGVFFAYHLPVSILRAVALIVILIVFFREEAKLTKAQAHDEAMTAQQKRLSVVLAGALFFWVTDFVHGVAPAWVALAAAIIVLWPQTRLLTPDAFKTKINLSPMLYLAGVLCIGALVQHSGLDAILGKAVVNSTGLVKGQDFVNYCATVVFSIIVCLLVTAAAAPVMLVPLAQQISDATGLSLEAVLMTQFFGFTTMFFPYQGPPLVVALGLCKITAASLIKTCSVLALIVIALGAPLNYLWWSILGLI